MAYDHLEGIVNDIIDNGCVILAGNIFVNGFDKRGKNFLKKQNFC